MVNTLESDKISLVSSLKKNLTFEKNYVIIYIQDKKRLLQQFDLLFLVRTPFKKILLVIILMF